MSKAKTFKPLPAPLEHLDPSVWQEEAVGVIRGYPWSEAAWRKRHRLPPTDEATAAFDATAAVRALHNEERSVRSRLELARAILEGVRDA